MNNITKTLLISVFMLVLAVQTSVASPLVCGDVGDVNGDKNITITDAAILLSGTSVINGDVNNDNITDTADVIEILQYVSGKRNGFSGCEKEKRYNAEKSVTKIEPDKTLSINGKRVFPQVFLTICSNTMTNAQCAANLKKANVYTADMVGYGYRSSDLSSYKENDVGVMPMVGHFPVESPNLFGYYQNDEPEWPKHELFKQIYNTIKAEDPNHIILTSVWHDGIKWEDTADVIWFGLYPYKNAAWINEMGARDKTLYKYEYIVKTNILIGTENFDTTNKPFWPVLQALSAPDDAQALPTTKEETRALMYTAITMNVKGLGYWSYSWTPNDAGLWKDQNKVNEHIALATEINDLSDVLLLPTKDYSWEYRKGNDVTFSKTTTFKLAGSARTNFNYMLKEDGNVTYLIIVNKDPSTLTDVEISVNGLNNGKVETIGNVDAGSVPGKVLNLTNGKFTDSFNGLEVKIYKIV